MSGHDIERWLLKTAKAVAALEESRERKGQRLSGVFARDDAILDMLDNLGHWPVGAGLYCVMNAGEMTQNHPRFQLQPFTNDHGEIEVLGFNILGLRFVLILEPLDVDKRATGRQGVCRSRRHGDVFGIAAGTDRRVAGAD